MDAACAGGGVKLAPSPDDLAAFLRACEGGGLLPSGIARALGEKLTRGSASGGEAWRGAYKAASCLEALAAAAAAAGAGGERRRRRRRREEGCRRVRGRRDVRERAA